MEGIYFLLGLAMITGQIFGIVRIFGGATTAPKWLDIVAGIFMILYLICIFGLASQ